MKILQFISGLYNGGVERVLIKIVDKKNISICNFKLIFNYLHKKTILHIVSGLSTGGAERMLAKLILETKDTLRHIVISLSGKGAQGDLLEKEGITVFYLQKSTIISLPILFYRLRKRIREIDPDLVHAWMYHANVAASIALLSPLRKSYPLIHSVRHSLHDIRYEKRTTQWAIRLNSFLSASADKITYNSHTSQMQHQQFGFQSAKSIVIPNGFKVDEYFCDENSMKLAKTKLSIHPASFTYLQIGRNHPMKNHRLFLESALMFIKKIDFDLKPTFILVGRGVTTDETLKSLKMSLDPFATVLLIDEVSDPLQYYCAADVFTLTSSWGEAFPNVLGEAMSCSLPCITTDVGDAAHIVGDSGMVVNPDDGVAFSECMLKIAEMDPAERKKLGKMARERISDSYSMGRIADQYIVLYTDLLNDQRSKTF